MGHKPDQKARKKRRDRETAAEKLRALSNQASRDALKNVDAWEKNCRRRMDDAAKNRSTSTEVEIHSAEKRSYPGSHETFISEFSAAADALKARLEADGSIKAPYRFKETEDETLEGGMMPGSRAEKREYPAAHKLVFTISW